jgi:hypothetical protein
MPISRLWSNASASRVCHPRKKAQEEERTIVWVDEAGFYLLPMAVRTWAPHGQTPVLRVPLTRDHLSAMSGITFDGRLFMQVRPASYDAAAVVRFLRVLLRKITGKLVVIWDGSPIHCGHVVLTQKSVEGKLEGVDPTQEGKDHAQEPTNLYERI